MLVQGKGKLRRTCLNTMQAPTSKNNNHADLKTGDNNCSLKRLKVAEQQQDTVAIWVSFKSLSFVR